MRLGYIKAFNKPADHRLQYDCILLALHLSTSVLCRELLYFSNPEYFSMISGSSLSSLDGTFQLNEHSASCAPQYKSKKCVWAFITKLVIHKATVMCGRLTPSWKPNNE